MTNILLVDILFLDFHYFHRSLAPFPVPTSTVFPSTATTTPSRTIPLSVLQTAPATTLFYQPITPSNTTCPITTFMTRFKERRNHL